VKHPTWPNSKSWIRIGQEAEIYHWLSDKNIIGKVYIILHDKSFTLLTEEGHKYKVCFDKFSKMEKDDRLIRRIK